MKTPLAEKDAEIERLKTEQIKMFKAYDALEQKSVGLKAECLKLDEQLENQATLITELADALVKDDQTYVWYNEGDDLIQRARKVTSK